MNPKELLEKLKDGDTELFFNLGCLDVLSECLKFLKKIGIYENFKSEVKMDPLRKKTFEVMEDILNL